MMDWTGHKRPPGPFRLLHRLKPEPWLGEELHTAEAFGRRYAAIVTRNSAGRFWRFTLVRATQLRPIRVRVVEDWSAPVSDLSEAMTRMKWARDCFEERATIIPLSEFLA